IDEIEVVNDYEINIHTSIPFAPLASHLAHSTAGIMPKELIDADYQAALDAVESDMTLDEYYEARANGTDAYEEIKDELGEKLETGWVQIATDIDSSNIERIENGADTALAVKDSVRMSYLGFNTEKEPFNDPKVRQAISYAIDREEIVAGVYDDMGIPAKGPLAPDVWGYTEELEGVGFDIEKAKELLAETDVADGFSTTIWVNDDQQIIDTAVYIQNALSELNINVEIEQFEWGTY